MEISSKFQYDNSAHSLGKRAEAKGLFQHNKIGPCSVLDSKFLGKNSPIVSRQNGQIGAWSGLLKLFMLSQSCAAQEQHTKCPHDSITTVALLSRQIPHSWGSRILELEEAASLSWGPHWLRPGWQAFIVVSWVELMALSDLPGCELLQFPALEWHASEPAISMITRMNRLHGNEVLLMIMTTELLMQAKMPSHLACLLSDSQNIDFKSPYSSEAISL